MKQTRPNFSKAKVISNKLCIYLYIVICDSMYELKFLDEKSSLKIQYTQIGLYNFFYVYILCTLEEQKENNYFNGLFIYVILYMWI